IRFIIAASPVVAAQLLSLAAVEHGTTGGAEIAPGNGTCRLRCAEHLGRTGCRAASRRVGRPRVASAATAAQPRVKLQMSAQEQAAPQRRRSVDCAACIPIIDPPVCSFCGYLPTPGVAVTLPVRRARTSPAWTAARLRYRIARQAAL